MNNPMPSKKYNRFEMGLELLSHLEDELLHHKSSNEPAAASPSPAQANLQFRYPLPLLENIIQDLAPLPENMMIIGSCDDGLPIILDMTNPSSGSILVTGERGCGKTHLLSTMARSVCLSTPARLLRVAGVTTSQLEWQAIAQSPHGYKWASTHSLEAQAILRELTRVSGQRSTGPAGGNMLILVIDSLAELVQNLDTADLQRLTDLVSNGPARGIWTIASAGEEEASVDLQLSNAFRTHLIGHSKITQPWGRGPENIPPMASELVPGAQFCVNIDGQWVNFWIPA